MAAKQLGQLTLTLDNLWRGRSSINFIFYDNSNPDPDIIYYMSLREFYRIVYQNKINNRIISGKFEERKVGTAELIYLVDE